MKSTMEELPPLKTIVLVKRGDDFDIAQLIQFGNGTYEWQCWNHDSQYSLDFFEKWQLLPE